MCDSPSHTSSRKPGLFRRHMKIHNLYLIHYTIYIIYNVHFIAYTPKCILLSVHFIVHFIWYTNTNLPRIGVHKMRRICDSPPSARGGLDCSGTKDLDGYQYQYYSCNEQHCPGH